MLETDPQGLVLAMDPELVHSCRNLSLVHCASETDVPDTEVEAVPP